MRPRRIKQPARSARKKANKRSPPAAPAERRTVRTRFGDVPLLRRPIELGGGRVHWQYEYDPEFRPKMPDGALRGDIRKQVYCPCCSVPLYYYVDERKQCVECGQAFQFGAKEQKFWYEQLGFILDSTAIRCPPCRKKRRSAKTLRGQIAAAKRRIEQRPGDAGAYLELSQSLVQYNEITGQGDLDEAVAAARKCRKLSSVLREASYWEGAAQHRAGRLMRARERLEIYLAQPPARARDRSLHAQARIMLAQAEAGDSQV